MKKLLVLALALASVNAHATRARILSLGDSPHLVDTQTIFRNPAMMFYVGGDFVTIEAGATTGAMANANQNAEGMVVRSMGDAKLGLALGHQSKNASGYSGGLRAIAPAAGVTLSAPAAGNNQQNPIELSYGMKTGDMAWAGTLIYSNYSAKTLNEKESSMGLRAGAKMGAWDFEAGLGLGNTLETPAGKLSGTAGISAGAGYVMDTMYLYGKFVNAGVKVENAAGQEAAKLSSMDISVGVVNSHKKDANEFFYGVALMNGDMKRTIGVGASETKITSLTLPVIIGLEVDANSWLTLRGSLTQTTLINQTKTDTAGVASAEFAPNANSTAANLGVGIKFNNKLTLDGTLTAGNTGGLINSGALLAQGGLTYMF